MFAAAIYRLEMLANKFLSEGSTAIALYRTGEISVALSASKQIMVFEITVAVSKSSDIVLNSV